MAYCLSCGAESPPAARYCPDCGTALTPSAQAFQAIGSGDELRPVTALFADVVGSTSLGERLSPDEVKVLVGECVTRMSRAVEEFGGHVQAYMGDGMQVLVEGGSLEQKGQWTVSLLSASRLSPELQALLVARIDLLPDAARRLAQIAAVIGRSFPRELLATVAGTPGLDDALRALLRADILREQRRYPEPEYGFRHKLFQEAALSTLTPARKRELYARIAAAFEGLYARSLDDRLEQLAHYHAQAGDSARAIGYLERAAAAAEARGAAEQGQALWQRVQRLAARTGDSEAERRAGERIAVRTR